MEPAKSIRLLMGLDLSEMDAALIDYLSVARKLYPIAHITFLHNVKVSELPEELRSPEMLEKIKASVSKKLSALISKGYLIEEPYQITVTTSSFSETAFLDISKRISPHLVLLGNKQEHEGSGGLPQKLIRMLPCATLLVPETFDHSPKKIIGAIDFSKYSQIVGRIGQQLLHHNQQEQLTFEPIHIAKISWQFFPGPSEKEIKKILKEETQAKQKKWAKAHPDLPPLTVVDAQEKNIASTIIQYAERSGAATLILGVKGASSLTGLFMGSVANELIQRSTHLSILLVKQVLPN
ncbi:universal stress protein [Olivibacter sp. SDN3]|uniref:universal stress protein n=1 Tax=Olivibacter sp. SDN3 TaxID=2764720 RepID=UPI0016515E6B|nr:universal stress protein [Olivibacter sp. SDN3]QNL51733.1 universal stress protein [Olivibacter sp. SDN3]